MKNFLICISFCLSFLFSGLGLQAQLHKIGRAFKGAAKVVTQAVSAPPKIFINAAKAATGNGSVTNILRPVVKLAQTTGNTVVNVAAVANAPQMALTQQAQKYAARLGGRPGAFLFDLGTFMQTYSSELATSGVQIGNNVLNGQNPFQVIGAPLAAAIRAARDRYNKSARPLPDDVKAALRGRFPPEILEKARYAIGSVEITLPSVIATFRKLFGSDDFAVTVDDIIVFPKDPGGYSQNCEWWSHEITHVRQYTQWGVEKFAYNYVKNHASVENEAIQNAINITGGNWCLSPQQRVELVEIINERERNAVIRSANDHGPNHTSSILNSNESYVSQCVINGNSINVMFLVTNQHRIISFNPSTGESMHVGFANPPWMPNVAWSFDLPNQGLKYSVSFNGTIYSHAGPIYNYYGEVVNYQRWTNVGYVRDL